jgi:hypothetical protein
MNNDKFLAGTVDRLAQVKAEISKLKKEEEGLRKSLIESGLEVIESDFFRAAVSLCDGNVSTDWETIARRFKPSYQLIRRHTTKGDAYHKVRVSARKSSEV